MAGWLAGTWHPRTQGPCPVIGLPKDGMSRACLMLLLLSLVLLLLPFRASGIAMHTSKHATCASVWLYHSDMERRAGGVVEFRPHPLFHLTPPLLGQPSFPSPPTNWGDMVSRGSSIVPRLAWVAHGMGPVASRPKPLHERTGTASHRQGPRRRRTDSRIGPQSQGGSHDAGPGG